MPWLAAFICTVILSDHTKHQKINRTLRRTFICSLALFVCSASRSTKRQFFVRLGHPGAKIRWARRANGAFANSVKIPQPSASFCKHKVFYVSNRDPALSCEYGRNVMHAVMRDYSGSGAKKFFDLLENKKAEVKDVIMPIKGFVSYSLVRTARGGFSVTICQDKAGTDESVRVAREWIAKNARDTRVARPKISAGAVILHL
jgi:hypothetical protein